MTRFEAEIQQSHRRRQLAALGLALALLGLGLGTYAVFALVGLEAKVSRLEASLARLETIEANLAAAQQSLTAARELSESLRQSLQNQFNEIGNTLAAQQATVTRLEERQIRPPSATPGKGGSIGSIGSGGGGRHVVRAGDSLAKIARQNGITINDLLAINPGLDGLRLHPGQILRIPQLATAPSPAAGPDEGVIPNPPDPGSAPSPADDTPEFPDPPPRPTTFAKLPESILPLAARGTTLYGVSRRLEAAMQAAGFTEASYYRFRDGFALVARVEQIDAAGHPLPPPDRWSAQVPKMQTFRLAEYLARLFSARPGHYRLVAFLTTRTGIQFSDTQLSAAAASQLLHDGSTTLPAELVAVPTDAGTTCYALVYEFRKDSESSPAQLNANPTIDALGHLRFAGIAQGLEGYPGE